MVDKSDINFRSLVYEVNDGIYICDLNGTFIYANLALANMFGFERSEELIGKNLEEFFAPGRVKAFMNQFWKTVESGNDQTLFTEEIIKRDGSPAQIEINPMPFIKNRSLLGSQGVVHDITERKEAEDKLMYNATHDALTGIYNRTFFEAEVKRLERGRQFPISTILICVGIKNDAGDLKDNNEEKLIKRVAHQLYQSCRGDDIVARVADDEFEILLPNVDADAVDKAIARIKEKLMKIDTSESDLELEFYSGVGTAKKGESVNEAIKQAQAVAYLEKKKKSVE